MALARALERDAEREPRTFRRRPRGARRADAFMARVAPTDPDQADEQLVADPDDRGSP